jgi:hypothetical protein
MPNDIVIGARQLKNPKGIEPTLDTDIKPTPPKPLTHGGQRDIRNAAPDSEQHIIPKQHPIEEWFGRGIKRSNGRSIPKEDVTISDN